ncbi:MAG: hypothetical protein HOY79_33670 [Streptomyces sp.]|nr:hypothetical protein [Streptomyces sp.]NUS11358.1 hypothetical protein [Streptomyces sp.]NUS23501.1 hypothetical protein [Streptomyces sp.]
MTRTRHVRIASVVPGAVPVDAIWAFRDRLHRVGEHRIWQGTADRGTTPVLVVDQVHYAARRIAWVLHHNTEPVGIVKTTCGVRLCVEGAHLSDERSRQADHVLYAALVHGVILAGDCRNGHDRAALGYVRADGKTGCRGCDNARRRTTACLEGATAA